MKKSIITLTVLAALFFCNNTFAQSVTIKKCISYAKGMMNGDPRIVALLSNNTFWWTNGKKDWEQIPSDGMPKQEVLDLEVVQKQGMMGQLETRLIVLLKNNQIYWYADGKDWEGIAMDGLPKTNIKDISVYNKNSGSILQSSRIIVVLENNEIYGFNGKDWQKVEAPGLPLK